MVIGHGFHVTLRKIWKILQGIAHQILHSVLFFITVIA